MTDASSVEPGAAARDAFDRVGARAWRLALWIVADEAVASDVVAAAFAGVRDGLAPDGDARLLCEVRAHAAKAAAARPATPPPASSARVVEALGSLTDLQRAVLDLALIARLTSSEIALALSVPCAEVHALLSFAMRAAAPPREDATAGAPEELVGGQAIAAIVAVGDLDTGTAPALS